MDLPTLPSHAVHAHVHLSSCSNSCSLHLWCYLAISSSAFPFTFCLQSYPASGSFPVSPAFSWGSQSIRASASISVLPMNSHGWFPLGLTGLNSLQSSVFSSTPIRKLYFFGAQLSLWTDSILLLGKAWLWLSRSLSALQQLYFFNMLSRFGNPREHLLLWDWGKVGRTSRRFRIMYSINHFRFICWLQFLI